MFFVATRIMLVEFALLAAFGGAVWGLESPVFHPAVDRSASATRAGRSRARRGDGKRSVAPLRHLNSFLSTTEARHLPQRRGLS